MVSRAYLRYGALAIFLVGGACKDEPPIFENDAAQDAATAYCDRLFSCTCAESAGFSSKEACFAMVNEQLRDQQVDAVNEMLTYDAGCVADLIDGVDSLACSRDPGDVTACSGCFAYHGAVPENAPCARHGTFSGCAQGLACVTQQDGDGDPLDLCTPACLRVGEGAPCSLTGPDFRVLRSCDDGLICDADDSGVCIALPSAGSPCEQGALCAPNAWCDGASDPAICAALKADQEGCSSDLECASTWCRNGERCAQPLAEETPCDPQGDRCDVGLQCAQDHPFCVPTDALLCQLPPIAF